MYNNILANNLPSNRPSTSSVGSKVHNRFFLKVVKLHITIKGMERRTPCKQLFCTYSNSRPVGGSKDQNSLFSECHYVAWYITGIKVQNNIKQ